MSFQQPRRKPLTHGLTRAAWDELRGRVKERDHFRCVFYPVGCKNGLGTDGHGKGLHVDHIIAWSVSRDNSTHNLRTLCDRHHAILGERISVNPFFELVRMEEVGALNEMDRAFTEAFGPLATAER